MRNFAFARPTVAAVMCACAIVLAATSPALATVKPVGGTEVGLERDPGNSIVARGNTDSDGNVSFRKLAPGHYTLTIDNRSLNAAIAKSRSASANEKKSSSSLTLGVGGFFGGGSSHSSSPHQDTKGGPAYGHPDKTTHSSSSGGGGIGVGLSIPVGGSNPSESEGPSPEAVRFVVGVKGDLGGGWSISTIAPVCPDAPGDVRIGFDVRQGGTVTVQVNALDDVNAAISDVAIIR